MKPQDQTTLAGAEGSAKQAQAARDQQHGSRLHAKAAQKPLDSGLFDVGARSQADMFGIYIHDSRNRSFLPFPRDLRCLSLARLRGFAPGLWPEGQDGIGNSV